MFTAVLSGGCTRKSEIIWNRGQRASWLSSVHPAFLLAHPTTLHSFLQQVLQVPRNESCMFWCNRSITCWGCVPFPRSTWWPCLRSWGWTEMLQQLLWWADQWLLPLPCISGMSRQAVWRRPGIAFPSELPGRGLCWCHLLLGSRRTPEGCIAAEHWATSAQG